MPTMAIETDLYPTASFVTTSDIMLPADVTAGGQASVNAVGDLTVHGVTQSVAMPLEAQHTGGRIEVLGTLTFPWDSFGMKQPNLSYVTLGRSDSGVAHLLRPRVDTTLLSMQDPPG